MKILFFLVIMGVFINLMFVSASTLDVHYQFDETSGTIAEDSEGSNNNGTLINMDNWWTADGYTGNALHFNGTDEYVKSAGVLNVDNNFTVMAWINVSNNDTTGMIASYSTYIGGNNPGFHLRLNIAGTLSGAVWCAGGEDPTFNSNETIPVFEWVHVALVYNGTGGTFYINGKEKSAVGSSAATGNIDETADSRFRAGAWDDALSTFFNGTIDDVRFYNESKTEAEIQAIMAVTNEITSALNLPVNAFVTSASVLNFTASQTTTGYNLTNVTYYVWYTNSTLFNSTEIDITGQVWNSTNLTIHNFTLENYLWNAETCGVLATDASSHTCSFASSNFSLTIGASILGNIWSNHTFETKNEFFQINISLLAGSSLSEAQLIYNGTSYIVSDIITIGNTYSLTRFIDIPTNPYIFQNTTRNFHWRFTFSGNAQAEQNTTIVEQDISYINLQRCNFTYNIQTLNFTIKDQLTGDDIDITTYNVSMKTFFTYWLGGGDEKKNYSFQQLNSSLNKSFQFCIFPFDSNFSFSTDMNMDYDVDGYSENNYYLRNSSITNESRDIDLFTLSSLDSTKFYITVQQGVTPFSRAVVTVSKYFTGEGVFKTTGIKMTDDSGEFVDYLDLDNTYKFSIVKDGVFYGVIEKQASCSVAPCEITLQIAAAEGDIFAGYDSTFASNIYSNLSYDPSTENVTYEFIDITGLAQYFRLVVSQTSLNVTDGEIICDEFLYSSSGTLTCSVSGYEGDFFAYGYISRSPQLVDKIISFIISTVVDALGLIGVFLCLGIIMTVCIAAAVISRGNPAVVVFVFGVCILLLKLSTILPFSWIIVSLIELLVLFIMWSVRT